MSNQRCAGAFPSLLSLPRFISGKTATWVAKTQGEQGPDLVNRLRWKLAGFGCKKFMLMFHVVKKTHNQIRTIHGRDAWRTGAARLAGDQEIA